MADALSLIISSEINSVATRIAETTVAINNLVAERVFGHGFDVSSYLGKLREAAEKTSPQSINTSFYQKVFKPVFSQFLQKDPRRSYEPKSAVLRWKPFVEQASTKYGVPKELLYAIIHQESGGDPSAKASRSSAAGLMQFITATADTVGLKTGSGIDERMDPSKAIDAGARLLSDSLRRFNGDVSMAVMAYHQGDPTASKIYKNAMEGRFSEALQPLMRWDAEGLKYIPSVVGLMESYRGI